MAGVGATGGGHDQDVDGLRQVQRAVVPGVRDVLTWGAAVVADGHVEAQAGAPGDGLAHRAEAQQAQALAADRRADHPVPLATTSAGVGARNIAQQRQQHGHGVVGNSRGIGASAIGDSDATGGSGDQVDLLVTSTDHADDLQLGQGGDFSGGQAQRPAGQHGVNLAGMALDGVAAHLRGRGTNQAVAGLFQQRQIIVDGFYQYQDSFAHATSFNIRGALCGVTGRYSQWGKQRGTVLYGWSGS